MPRRTAAVLFAVLALLALACQDGGRVTSNRPEEERPKNAPYAFKVNIAVFIGSEQGLPAEVLVDVRDPKGGHDSIHDIITQNERKWRTTVRYEPGWRLDIRVEVKPSRPKTGAACEIYDGTNTTIDGPNWQSWRAICTLVTSR